MEKSFTIKLQGKILSNMEKLSKGEFRSVTQQIHKIINDFIENNPVKPDYIEEESKTNPDDVF